VVTPFVEAAKPLASATTVTPNGARALIYSVKPIGLVEAYAQMLEPALTATQERFKPDEVRSLLLSS
jgi:hypothetical protein